MPMSQEVKDTIVDKLESFIIDLCYVKSRIIENEYEEGLNRLGKLFEDIDQLGMLTNIATSVARQREQENSIELDEKVEAIKNAKSKAINVVAETGTFDAQVARALNDSDDKS